MNFRDVFPAISHIAGDAPVAITILARPDWFEETMNDEARLPFITYHSSLIANFTFTEQTQ